MTVVTKESTNKQKSLPIVHEAMVLIDKDRQIFIQSLLEPPAPNDLLIKAARKYKKEEIFKTICKDKKK